MMILQLAAVLLTFPILIRGGIWIRYIIRAKKSGISSKERAQWKDVTARITTLGRTPSVIQETVHSLPDNIGDVQVVTEENIDIDGAKVHVVPESFSCAAENKGRALEWARRSLESEEWVLFLDEDSKLETNERPIKDNIVQLRQIPQFCNSYLSWYSEMLRMGVATEIYGFKEGEPHYIWGGGLLVKKKVEDEITWNRDYFQEDSGFIRKALENGYKYKIARKPKIINQSPKSVKEIISQRRRWESDLDTPFYRRVMSLFSYQEGSIWGLNSIMGIVWLSLIPTIQSTYIWVFMSVFFLMNIIWIIRGSLYMRTSYIHLLVSLVLLPIIMFVNGAGNIYGVFFPVDEFKSTEKL